MNYILFFLPGEKSVPARNDLHWEADMQMTSHYVERKVIYGSHIF